MPVTTLDTTAIQHVLRVSDLSAAQLAALLDLAAVMKRHASRRAAVIDGPGSLAWIQAANRLPTEQALLYALVTGDWEV